MGRNSPNAQFSSTVISEEPLLPRSTFTPPQPLPEVVTLFKVTFEPLIVIAVAILSVIVTFSITTFSHSQMFMP